MARQVRHDDVRTGPSKPLQERAQVARPGPDPVKQHKGWSRARSPRLRDPHPAGTRSDPPCGEAQAAQPRFRDCICDAENHASSLTGRSRMKAPGQSQTAPCLDPGLRSTPEDIGHGVHATRTRQPLHCCGLRITDTGRAGPAGPVRSPCHAAVRRNGTRGCRRRIHHSTVHDPRPARGARVCPERQE